MTIAQVGPSDVLLDLGCGDGRVLVAAASAGARAFGFDVRRNCLAKSVNAAELAGLSHLIEVCEHDLMRLAEHHAYHQATVLYAYLIPSIIGQLEPLFRRAVSEGKRVLIYCTSGCEPHGVPTSSKTPGNAVGDLVPAERAMLGMLRLYRRGDSISSAAAGGAESASSASSAAVAAAVEAAAAAAAAATMAEVTKLQGEVAAVQKELQKELHGMQKQARYVRVTTPSAGVVPRTEGGDVVS